MDDDLIIARRICTCMKYHHISAKDISKAMNVCTNTVQCWMCGKSKPRTGDICKLCTVLGCTPDYLLGWSAI